MIFVLLLTIITYFYDVVHCDCIFINDCPKAARHLELARTDPRSVEVLRQAHCGFGLENGRRAPKIWCDKVTEYPRARPDNDDCVPLSSCAIALELIDTRHNNPETVSILRHSACTRPERKEFYVRCNLIMRSVSDLGEAKLALLPRNCGLVPSIPNIVNAEGPTDLDEYPWVGIIKYKNHIGKISFGCVGSLINSKYVVTAAHCINLPAIQKERLGEIHLVVFGEYDLKNEIDCTYSADGQKEDCGEPVHRVFVEQALAHPEFQYPDGKHDIGLLRLKKSVTFTDFIMPICLPLQPLQLKEDEVMFITGWGRTEKGRMSDIKLKASVFFITSEHCNPLYRRHQNIISGQICAGAKNGSDICSGDSGGPLMVNRKYGKVPHTFLAGVVSYNIRCGSEASVYTDVTRYLNWILDNIRE